MPIVTIDGVTVSTNDVDTHRKLKIKAAQSPDWTIGKLVDIYARLGMELNLETLSKEKIEELKELLKSD
jgi:hypothetical protein